MSYASAYPAGSGSFEASGPCPPSQPQLESSQPSLSSSPSSSRLHQLPNISSSISSLGPPPPPSIRCSANVPHSLVGQLLGTSAQSNAGGATPYGMIVSGRSGPSMPSGTSATLETRAQEPLRNHTRARSDDRIIEGRGLVSETLGSHKGTKVPEVLGYSDITPIYSINYVQVLRARSITGKRVVLKLCTVNHLDTLARLRFEWKMLSDVPTPPSKSPIQTSATPSPSAESYVSGASASNPISTEALASLGSIVRPFAWDYLKDGGVVLVYLDEPPHKTVHEVFLPGMPQQAFEQTAGTDMPTVKPRTQSDLIKILQVFSAIVGVLEVAHRAGVTHNNINTHSILVAQEASGRLQGKLGGWHLASRLEREDVGRVSGGALLRGENPAPLQYIPPECTGRMNRTVDYRADFYSLGVALYELVVGFLPFRSSEPLELIHMHIAQPPKPPQDVNPSIPSAVSGIIMKLLAKTAEERYQTASGLRADLDLTIRLLTEGKPLESLRIGELDTTSQFVITEKLYGREEAVNALRDAYYQCLSTGGCTMVTIRGPSGIGKSRLVNEIQRPVVERKGFFTSGKFDQYRRGFSFFTLVQTLQDLIRQVLSEPPVSLARWRTDTIRAFDGDAAVLVDVIPELKLLLGPEFKMEPLADLGPVERESRFRAAFGRLLAVFGRKGVVIFLDDLQWCSQSEFMLISNVAEEINRKMRDWESSSLLTNGDEATPADAKNQTTSQSAVSLDRGILLIGAYRDSEVGEDSPLPSMLQYMKQLSVRVIDITLKPLDQESVRRIIGDTLHRDPESDKVRKDPEMQTLTELVYAKTEGNPFFVVQLLKTLYRGGHIVFEYSSKGGGQWRFNLTSIEADDLPLSVVDLLVKQMLKLSEETRTALMLASCIGTERISLEVLATAAGKGMDETATALWQALDSGLLLPTSGNYKIHLALESSEIRRREAGSPVADPQQPMTARFSPPVGDNHEVTYRFLHDRVRQAAYSLIPDIERAGVHRMIGERMLVRATEEDLSSGMIYEVVNQLNHWLAPLDYEERRQLMELNLRAGKKALQATAFSTALNYFLVAKKVLDTNPGNHKREPAPGIRKRLSFGLQNLSRGLSRDFLDRDHRNNNIHSLDELGTEINISLMEGYFADVKYEQSIALAEEILPRCEHRKDKVRCLINKMNCLFIQGRLNEAIENGLKGLGILSWEVPLDDDEATKHARMIKPRILLGVNEIKAIAQMHELNDENLLLLQEIISALILPVYMARPALLPAVCFTSVAITLEYGISSAGTLPILMTGVILGGSNPTSPENLIRSYAFGRLAITLIERDSKPHAMAPAIYEVYAGHIGIFHQNMNEVIQYLQQAVSTGLSTYNVDYCSFAMAEITSFAMLGGEHLQTIHSKMITTKPNVKRFKQESGMWWLSLPLQFLLNLRGMGNPDPLCFEGEELGNSKDLTRLATSESLSHTYIYNMFRVVICAIYGSWNLAADLATHSCEPIRASMVGTFYAALADFYASLAFCENYDKISDEQKTILARARHDLKQFSIRAKNTWLHKSILIETECMRVGHGAQQLQILDSYDNAIALANQSGFIHDAALINERCGAWLAKISKRRACAYVREAYRLYNSWGATHKAEDLKKKYPDEFANQRESRPTMLKTENYEGLSPPDSAQQRNSLPVSPRQSPRYTRPGATDYGFDQRQAPMFSAGSMGSGVLNSDQHEEEAGSQQSSSKVNESSLGTELDFRTVLKASLVISEGMQSEEQVIVSLMKCVLQTAGADYGALILKEEGQLHIETIGLLDQVSIIEHEPLARRPDLVPISVVNIVSNLGDQILRNGDDPKFELTFGRDPYFQQRKAKSMLCMPIQNQLKTLGVLYLENGLVSHAFTRQRQELLNLLCTQAAVTIDKARLYRQMEQAKKEAEEMTAEKSTFLANMSHEIRTPFNALLSCSIFLLDTHLNETQREYVETIRNSAVLTLQIIDGILDFSKIEHGAIDLQSTPFSLRDCIETALQLAAEPAATKDIDLAYRNRCSDIDYVFGDITRYRQVTINLIGNAVKFTEEGHILVETTAEELPDSDGRWKIRLSVKDTGIGIPESAFGRLFRAFSQVDTSTRRTYGGTGLGLAISKKLAQMMGGDIWFKSQEGKGTTFYYEIVTTKVIKKVWTSDKRLEGRKAIVADTHPISSVILADELRREGLTVDRTKSVQETLNDMRTKGKGYYDVALIDVSVDHTFQIMDTIKEFDPSCKLILMSRFGSTISAQILNKATLSFVRPAPRARYVEAVIDALNPTLEKRKVIGKVAELEIMRTLSLRHPLNILLAEDNPVNTRVALQHLKRMGYTSCKHAKDGIEVLELCEAAVERGAMFDVILMDVQMPRADGITTTRELFRRYREHERPTIIALTANATASDREKCHRVGMTMHITKPILPNDLATALMSVTPLARVAAASVNTVE